jgi:hypothetical protein
MIYQNQELSQEVFVSNDNQRYATWQQLKTEPLNREIYFKPSISPRLNRLDYRDGSCFANWHLPSGSILIDGDSNQVNFISEVMQTLDINEYKTQVDQSIRQCITKAFQENDIVNLSYSGSMDSTIVLAYIANMGLIDRTRTVCFKNRLTTKQDALRFDVERINSINKFFHDYQDKLAGYGWEIIEVGDLVKIINAGATFNQLLSFTLAAVLTRNNNQAWMGGWHGNRTMLHHRMLLDQMRLLDSNNTLAIKQRIDNCWETSYSHTIRKLDFDIDPVHIRYQSNQTKTWHALNNYQGHKIYMPLGLESMFQNLRLLDPNKFVFEFVADGLFGMELIQNNAPELLHWMSKKQSENDIDSIEYVLVPTETLDYSNLKIPDDINHHPDGIEWLELEIENSRITGEIEFNTLLSIKNLQWISDKVHGR